MDVQIPDKLYFKIGEVSEITGVKPHVLRYWESEFSVFSPGKSRKKQRLYQKKDIELVLRIKDLLYKQGFTIAGARKKLRESPKDKSGQPDLPFDSERDRQCFEDIRRDLIRLRKLLDTGL